MIRVKFEADQFLREMNNIIDYSTGFLEGTRLGKTNFLRSVGSGAVESLKEFIDTNARMDPQALHHVYEWGMTGSSDRRLYEISYTVSNLGLSIKSTFKESTSIKSGSKEPFVEKAAVMESGRTVTVSPRKSPVLVFEDNGTTVFTPNSVEVKPGGEATDGAYQQYFDMFMSKYFAESFLKASGIHDRIKRPVVFKKNLPAGAKGGRRVGIDTGYRWISNVVID
jgi:hypothetical protein